MLHNNFPETKDGKPEETTQDRLSRLRPFALDSLSHQQGYLFFGEGKRLSATKRKEMADQAFLLPQQSFDSVAPAPALPKFMTRFALKHRPRAPAQIPNLQAQPHGI